ncbi:hypothetical protein ABZX74_07800 [Streptomyces olivaceoviridis]|uniref:hypothetical protein n=1 Tax=Streptomyces olivaceoviridis TaxID=1921 RepID=UPI0033B6AE16
MTVRRRLHRAVARPGAGHAGVVRAEAVSAEVLRPGGDGADGAGPVAGPGTAAGSRLAFVTSGRLARAAGRGLFDFPLLDEEPPLPEHRGRLREPDTVGGPEPVAAPNALTGVTARLELAASAGPGGPADGGLSGPRAAADVRSGGSPGPYGRAAELLRVARRLWGSWGPGGVPRPFAYRGRRFDSADEFGLPRSPRGRPVVIQAGDPGRAREPAAASADVLLARHYRRRPGWRSSWAGWCRCSRNAARSARNTGAAHSAPLSGCPRR